MRALASFVLLLLLGHATAMEIQFEDIPGAPLDPESETSTITLVALVGCEELLPRFPGPEGTSLTWDLSAPAPVIVVGPRSTNLDATTCAAAPLDPVRVATPFEISVTRDLLAFQDTLIDVTATLGGGQTGQPLSVDDSFSIQADAYLLIQAQAPVKLKQGKAGQDTPIALEVTNFGNALTQIDFSLVEEPERARVVLPEPIRLASPNGDGKTSATVDIMVTPDRGAQQQIKIRVTSRAVDDPDQTGEPIEVHFLIRDGSLLGRATPASPVLPVLLLALAFTATRRFPRNDR